MTNRHGTARLRGLAAELIDARLEANLNTRDAAKAIGVSAATLNRMENGNRAVSPEDVAALLAVYGVTGLERERVLDLARKATQPGWWEITSGSLPEELPALITFEAEATRIVHAAMLRIPGLLQTAEYTRAVMTTTGVPDEEANTRVSARLGRQAILSKAQPPQYTAIIDEAALRRPIGTTGLMIGQLRKLIASAQQPNIDVRVIPFAHGAHTGLDGSYVLMEFARARDIVHLEHKRSSAFVDQPEDVAPFHEATDTLLRAALGPADSADFLADIAADYDQG
ncbi:helix-turn-helix protein [Tamaricihabitans halophyticus]|uniref:Helix-turn-helix protein n=1 Tax=Tamaricihabitans halophyticus TaxID=1262583 RepID=A0A4R2QVC1_9PSEU|nr:helix-turn-helix transcriptional regulator [Tamaricihabitans halophyticus]TCP53980.1 helix-turn-helix protein [Tamaricihabitans halophyticus]